MPKKFIFLQEPSRLLPPPPTEFQTIQSNLFHIPEFTYKLAVLTRLLPLLRFALIELLAYHLWACRFSFHSFGTVCCHCHVEYLRSSSCPLDHSTSRYAYVRVPAEVSASAKYQRGWLSSDLIEIHNMSRQCWIYCTGTLFNKYLFSRDVFVVTERLTLWRH